MITQSKVLRFKMRKNEKKVELILQAIRYLIKLSVRKKDTNLLPNVKLIHYCDLRRRTNIFKHHCKSVKVIGASIAINYLIELV